MKTIWIGLVMVLLMGGLAEAQVDHTNLATHNPWNEVTDEERGDYTIGCHVSAGQRWCHYLPDRPPRERKIISVRSRATNGTVTEVIWMKSECGEEPVETNYGLPRNTPLGITVLRTEHYLTTNPTCD